MGEAHFSKNEALGKIGTKVILIEDLYSVGKTPVVRKDTLGSIISAQPLAEGLGMRVSESYTIKVVWEFGEKPPSIFSDPVSTYTKSEFEKYLVAA